MSRLGYAGLLLLVLVLRHPAGVLNADFWAEDGWVWYPDAYADGLASVWRPQSGYLQTFSRLMALAVQPLPLVWAPTAFSLVAIGVMTAPPLFLTSSRMDAVWPGRRSRAAFGLLYVLLPNSFETFGNVTESQWHLAILAFLIVAGAPASTRAGRVFDTAALILSGLSGPCCLFLLPIAGWRALTSGGVGYRVACVGACALVQGTVLALTDAAARTVMPLGATPMGLARIAAVQIDLGLVLGARGTAWVMRAGLLTGPLVAAVAVAGAALVGIACWRGSTLLRMASLYGAAIFAAALIHPAVALDAPVWDVLSRPGAGQRYDLVPMLVVAGALFALAGQTAHPRIAHAARLLCGMITIGACGDFLYPRLPPTGFDMAARAFQHAIPGTRATFQVQPPGTAPMVLVKR